MVSVGNSKAILFQISSNDWQQRQHAQNDSKRKHLFYWKSNSRFCDQEDNLWNISSAEYIFQRLKRQEWVDRWSMERIKRTHPSHRPPPVTSNSQYCTSIIIKHKEIATFPSSILNPLLKKDNRKVQRVSQAQVASNTNITQAKDMSCKHKKHAGLKHTRLTHACHDSLWKHPLSPKIW